MPIGLIHLLHDNFSPIFKNQIADSVNEFGFKSAELINSIIIVVYSGLPTIRNGNAIYLLKLCPQFAPTRYLSFAKSFMNF